MTCRYCRHSEMRCVFTPGKGTAAHLHCHQHNATVQRDDTCPEYEREPGIDDDLGDNDAVR